MKIDDGCLFSIENEYRTRLTSSIKNKRTPRWGVFLLTFHIFNERELVSAYKLIKVKGRIN